MTNDAGGGAGMGTAFAGLPAVVRKISKFSVVGLLSGVLYIAFTSLAIHLLKVEARTASVIAYLAVIPINFVLQRGFTFRSGNAAAIDFPKYIVAQAVSLLACYAAMALAVDVLGLHYTIGNAAGILIVPFITYFIMDKWVFTRQMRDGKGS